MPALPSSPTLPAVRSLGSLADVRPVVVIDTREQTPLKFARLASARGALQSGDYSFLGGEEVFAIERKSIADLIGCVCGEGRSRFFRELHRLRGFRFKRLLVVGKRTEIEAGAYRSSVRPRAVLATLATIEVRFDVPVVFCDSPAAAAAQVESWAFWFGRELVEQTNDIARAAKLGRCGRRPTAAAAVPSPFTETIKREHHA